MSHAEWNRIKGFVTFLSAVTFWALGLVVVALLLQAFAFPQVSAPDRLAAFPLELLLYGAVSAAIALYGFLIVQTKPGRRRGFIRDLSFLFTFGLSALFIMLFFMAYLSPDKTVVLDINHFGEGTPELVLIVGFLIPMLIIGGYAYIVDTWGT